MKKKLIALLFGIILLTGLSCFAENDNKNDNIIIPDNVINSENTDNTNNTDETSNNLNNSKMPTDEEIMQTIKSLNFEKSQEEYLFKQTKKQLEQMYSKKEFSPILNGDTTLTLPKEGKENIKVKKYSRKK